MKYFYRWCDNRTAACRGWCEEGDTIETRVVEASNDVEALKSILDDIDYVFYYEEDCGEYNDSDVEPLIDALNSIDIGGGFEFVFWVRREDDVELYNSFMNEDDFVGDPCCM